MSRIFICDWSRWQGKVIPAATVRKEGFQGVWIKASGSKANQDPFYIDPFFLDNITAVTNEGSLIRGVFHYLVPDYPRAQAAFLLDLLETHVGGPDGMLVKLDVEEPGVTYEHVRNFCNAWALLSEDHPLIIYTSKHSWLSSGGGNGSILSPLLEEAHWVSETIRNDPNQPYASQQVKGIASAWWDVNYGGWTRPISMQFTNNALIAGVRTSCSVSPYSVDELRRYTV